MTIHHRNPGEAHCHAVRGFSLLELVITILIVAVLAAIAAPRFADAAARQRARTAADRVASDIALARDRAQASSATYQISFNPSLNLYKYGTGQDETTVNLSRPPYECEIDTASFGNSRQISFNAFGVPAEPGTIVLSGGGVSYTLSVSASGEVSVQ